jgi:hypothetical protein
MEGRLLESQVSKLRQLMSMASEAVNPSGIGLLVRLEFDFTLPSPSILRALPAGTTFSRVTIFIVDPFLGGTPEIQLGTAATPSLFFDLNADQVSLTHQYDFDDLHIIPVPDNFILTLSPGLTSGTAVLFYEGLQ